MHSTAFHTSSLLVLLWLGARTCAAASSEEYVLWFDRGDAVKKGHIAAFQAVPRSQLSDTNIDGCLLLLGNGRADLLHDFPRRQPSDRAVQHMTYLYPDSDLVKGFSGRTWFGQITHSNSIVEEALCRLLVGVSNTATLKLNFIAFSGGAPDLAQTNLLWAASTNIVVQPGGWRRLTFTLSPDAPPERNDAATHFALSVETSGAPCVISSGSYGQPDAPARLERLELPAAPVLRAHSGQPTPSGAPNRESTLTLRFKTPPKKVIQP